MWNIDHLCAIGGMLNEGLVRAECEALILLIADYRADCVVDAWNPFACLAARAARQPLVTVIQADIHPGNPGFIWWRPPPPNLPTPAPVVSRVLARYRLTPISRVAELFVGDLTLVVGMPATDPVPATAPVTYIGPALWQSQDTVLPDWWDRLDSNRPIIWVYAGNPRYLPIASPVDSLVVLQACVAALAPLDIQVVLTTGFHDLPPQISPLPANFHFAPFVPGVAMARRSQLLIHHGGYGSCQTGLVAGTPAVIIPTYSERESNARRLAAAGAAEFVLPQVDRLGRRRVSVDLLRSKIQLVLGDPTYASKAQRLSAQLGAYGGPGQAATLIEGLLSESKR
jgi:UDP:flavonoid glycosyltransferase YjiC (YdhE family)